MAARTYAAIVRTAFQRELAYRAANLAGLATNAFFGALRAYVLIALFNAQGGAPVEGYTLRDAVTYTGLTQALIAYVALWGWWDLIVTIRRGDVATDLIRPLDYFNYWLAIDAGRAAVKLLWRGLPMMALYALVYPIVVPATLAQWLALAVSLVLAWLISFGWRFLISLAAFWTQDAIGIGRAAFALMTFLSGFLMPIRFLPGWMGAIMNATPFPSMVNAPIEIYLGLLDGPALLNALAIQAAWFVILYLLAQIVLAAGVRKLVIQGG
jgi:ABC-2 type transport system permease protein